MALLFQAKFYRAHHDWQRALTSATRSAELYPLPQALGYEADAQRAVGDRESADRTDALIRRSNDSSTRKASTTGFLRCITPNITSI